MACRSIYFSLALAFLVVLLNISCCTCRTVTWSSKSGNLTEEEREIVYRTLKTVEKDIEPNRNYYAGRIFSKYLNVNGKGVVIRLTRWSSQCSVSMWETTKGSELLDAFRRLLPTIQPYLVGKGSQWAAVSNLTDWIDYYVRDTYNKSEPPIPPPDARADKVISEAEGNAAIDCTIQPSMLLSHHGAQAFNQLYPGDILLSPNAKYKLTIPKSGHVMAACVLNFEDQDDNILWQSDSRASWPQDKCFLAFRSDGTMELWNQSKLIWNTVSACWPMTECAGAASLAVDDAGDVKLYRSVDDHLSVYWSAMSSN